MTQESNEPVPVSVPGRKAINGKKIPTVELTPKLAKYLQAMTKEDASDLHLKVDSPPHVRVDAVLCKTPKSPLTRDEMADMVLHLLTDEQLKEFDRLGGFDLAYQVPDGDRFRINVYRQRSEISMSIRRVTRHIPSLEQLHLPDHFTDITKYPQGLILVTGATGCGKSTTIASLLEYINQTRACHIVTIEDPIEYLYFDKKALVSQREIGIDVPDFGTALRMMLREDPDIILVGEIRDRETLAAALQASDTGHLVFGTLHSSSAPQAVSRMLEMVPESKRSQLQQSLAYNLSAVICQKLLPSVQEDVSRVPIIEVLRTTSQVQEKIETGKEAELADIIKNGKAEGMNNFTQSLYDRIQSEMIDPRIAYAVAPNVVELKMMVQGIMQSQSASNVTRA